MYAFPLKTESGWGYKIYLAAEDRPDTLTDHLYIKQEYVPGISGKHAFTSDADALRIANLVIWKISSGHQPIITKPELDSLGIVIK